MDIAEKGQRIAEEVAVRVGKRLREVLNSEEEFEIGLKGKADVVTEFDIWAEAEITKELRAAFPDHILIGEETVSELEKETGKSAKELVASSDCWIIDPIDGTNNFANRIPHVGISIAGFLEGERAVGVVYDPARDELFSARKGAGTTLNGRKVGVSTKDGLMQCVVATGFPYDRKNAWEICGTTFERFLAATRGVRRFGAATLDGCWVACGRFDCFYEYHLGPWDIAAISVIVEEAGGKIVNFIEQPAEDFDIFASSFLLSNNTLHQEFTALAKGK